MNSNSPLFYSPNELDEYVNTLSSDQMNELRVCSDNWVASVLHSEQPMQSRTGACPQMSFHSRVPIRVPVFRDHHQRQVPVFNGTEIDIDVERIINECPQPDSCMDDELQYELNLFPNNIFGSTQVASYMSDMQTESTPDFDLSPSSPIYKKTKERKKNETPSNPTRHPRRIDMNEWFIIDDHGKKRRPLLHEFLRLLLDNTKYQHIARYVDKTKGIFKIDQRKVAADLWKQVKGRNSDSEMTYEKLARGIRYYYSTGVILQNPGRFTFRFGSASGFGIILAFSKRSPIEIAEGIKKFNSDLISIELVQHLIQYIPNENEIDAFRHLSINKEDLPPTDRLMYEILQIPFYMERLNTLKFKLTIADNCRLLNDQMKLINEAYNFLHQSTDIKKFLEIILSVRNHINSTPTHRILTLDDLSKIYDLKTPKTRIPIMNIVSQICIDRHPEIFNLKDNYKLISSASKIELSLIKSEIEQMKQQSEQIQLWINKFEEKLELQKFLHHCQDILNEIFQYYNITNEQFNKTISYFTKQTTTSTIFLSIFANLIHSLQIK